MRRGRRGLREAAFNGEQKRKNQETKEVADLEILAMEEDGPNLQGLVKTAKTKTEQQQQEEEEQKQDGTTAAPSSLAVPMVVKEGIQRDSQVPAAGDEAVPFGLERLVTLEEFAEMEGALDAMRTVLADQHPEFAACAAAYGAPEVFARMEHLAEGPIIEP